MEHHVERTSSGISGAIERATLVEEPFPHLVVRDVLPVTLARVLLDEMPPLEVFTGTQPPGSNVRFALPSPQALAHPRPSPTWKTALAECNAGHAGLLRSVLHRLAGPIRARHPDFEERFGSLASLRGVPRWGHDRQRHEIGMDIQPVVNSPAIVDGSRVRGPHLDAPAKLFSGLLYLRAPGDDSVGAELELYAPVVNVVRFDCGNDTRSEYVRLVRTYPYEHNLLVVILNTPTSLHGVTPRRRTPHPRHHLHIVAEMAAPLFELPREGPQGAAGLPTAAAPSTPGRRATQVLSWARRLRRRLRRRGQAG